MGVRALRVPTHRLHTLRKDNCLRPLLYDRRGMKNVMDTNCSNFKLLLLAPGIGQGSLPDSIRNEFAEAHPFNVNLGYQHLSTEETLQLLLSEGTHEEGLPGSFETVGHLAHLNLRDQFWP